MTLRDDKSDDFSLAVTRNSKLELRTTFDLVFDWFQDNVSDIHELG
jgi:hypothetical protein